MPCISIQFDPEVGPLINLGYCQPASVKEAADSSAQIGTPAAHISIFTALIDTEADLTCISPAIAQQVGLSPIGKAMMSSATHSVSVNTYLVDLVIPFGKPQKETMSIVGSSMTVMEFQPNNPHYQALLGRDVICNGLFTMVGYDKRFSVCM